MKSVIILTIAFVLSIPLLTIPVFGEASYEILDNRFYNQPIVCIYEPNVPNARDVILDAWVKETELGVKQWQYELQQTATVKHDIWNIEVEKIPVDKQPYFDNQYCDVEIRFDATAPDAAYAGVHWMEGGKSQIRLVYTDLEVCKTWTDDYYRYQEWCYKEDYIRSKALGNVASHEFGHALGLEHYESDNPYENYEWSLDPYASPSIMTLAVHYDEDRNKIRKIDIDKVKEIYQHWGFGDPKITTPQEYPSEPKNFGGFEAFSSTSSEFYKESGKIQYVTISGKVTESVYSKRQQVLLTVTFPDGHEEEMNSMVLENRQFSFQLRIDKTTQTGDYSIAAKIRGYDSQTLTYSVHDDSAKPSPKLIPKSITEPQEIVSIPDWVKNNVKWWADGSIDDDSFVSGIQFLVKEGVIDVPILQKTVKASDEIPLWIRTNANWWADGLISDSDFVKGIEFLANSGIIRVD